MTGDKLTRAAILPHFGDPFALAYWLKWFLVWGKEVDALYIQSSNIQPEHANALAPVLEMVAKSTDKVVEYHAQIAPIQHGDAMVKLLQACQEDLVVFMEEDSLVHQKYMVDECFRRIENGEYDLLGSARGSCSSEIISKASEKFSFPLDAGIRDNGCNFWPNFLFGKRADFMRTNLHFNAMTWQPGEYIAEIDLVAPDVLVGDTFVWASLQLHAMGLKVGYLNQYHGSPDDPEDYRNRTNIWDGKCPWMHHGSLSSWGMLFDEHPRIIPGLDKGEVARRCQWWMTFVDWWVARYPGLLDEHAKAYRDGIYRLMALYGVSESEVITRQAMYREVLGGRV